MSARKDLSVRAPRPFQLLREAARVADQWRVTGSAMRRFQEAESWALSELKLRLEEMGEEPAASRASPAADAAREASESPAGMMARLLDRSRGVDPAVAVADLYRQTLSRLVPDQVAMLALLADKQIAPLCHVAAGRLPAGPVSVVVLANTSPLGRDAGVLLRDYVPQYISELLTMGVFESGPEDARLEGEYELLMADTQLRGTIERIRHEMKLYPRLQRFSVHLSDYGKALWRDCAPGV